MIEQNRTQAISNALQKYYNRFVDFSIPPVTVHGAMFVCDDQTTLV
ncbi:hypothetical protein [Rhodoferax sp.]|nr:hypothetical protein [Rhodoferax sp.]MDO8318923.1 hypothetical protein [Rhodoferax sp.]